MDAREIAVVGLISLGVVGTLVPRHARRRGRTLPEQVTAQLEDMGETAMPRRVTVSLKISHIPNPRYKLVDLDMDNGRTFTHVWIIKDRWPTLSVRRALRGFKPPHVIAVRLHRPAVEAA